MKRLFSFIITLYMALCFSSTAFADDARDEAKQTNERVSLEVFVEHWIKSNYQEDVEVSRVLNCTTLMITLDNVLDIWYLS